MARGATLVVDREMPPLAGHRAVVDQGDERGGHGLAHPTGEHAGRLGHEISLEAMAAGFVEQHAAPTGTDHHRHRA